MDAGIESLRQRGREIEERNRREQDEYRRKAEQTQNRNDEERRHRERMGTASKSSDSPSILSLGTRVSPKGLIIILMLSGLLYLAGFALDALDLSKGQTQSLSDAEPLTDVLEPEQESSLDSFPVRAANDRSSNGEDDSAPSQISIGRNDTLPSETALQPSILRALDSGESAGWEIGSLRGFVSVSTAVAAGAKVCRSIAFTIDGAAVSTAGPQTWCRANGSDWARII